MARSTGRRRQVAARRDLLTHLVAELTNEGIDHLIIESQAPDLDGRDRHTILDLSRTYSAGPAFTYEWRTYSSGLAGRALFSRVDYGRAGLRGSTPNRVIRFVEHQPPGAWVDREPEASCPYRHEYRIVGHLLNV